MTETKKITIDLDGPYKVEGNIPLVRKVQVVSEFGEPLTWKKTGVIKTSENYDLCRCGHSKNKPFCDSSHHEVDFDGTEVADSGLTGERQQVIPGGKGIHVRRDLPICSESGFCGNRLTNVDLLTPLTGDPQVRAQVMAMIEHCPSGSYVYSLGKGEPDVEPDLPQEIAVVTDITSQGPVEGPLWVSGGIPIERSDGKPFETRNRVTLCTCGKSANKPLCDGTHRMGK